MSGKDIASRINVMDQAIRKIVVPIVSLAGIIYEEISNDSTDGKLLGVYLAMLGFGMVPWARELFGTVGGSNGTHSSGSNGTNQK